MVAAQAVQWTKGFVSGRVHEDGRIEAYTRDVTCMYSPRPRSVEEIMREIGPDDDALRCIANRIPGPFETWVRFGVGVALFVATEALQWGKESRVVKVRQKYGTWGELSFVGPYRDADAPQTYLCADSCNGLARMKNLTLACLLEGLEIGFFTRKGWGRFVLPEELKQYQSEVDERQADWWGLARPKFGRAFDLPMKVGEYGRDTLDGQRTSLSAERGSGSAEVVKIARLEAPAGLKLQVRDIEHLRGNPDRGEKEWIRIDRNPVIISSREAAGPLMFDFNTGGLAAKGHVIELHRDSKDVNEKVRSVLDAMGWLRCGLRNNPATLIATA